MSSDNIQSTSRQSSTGRPRSRSASASVSSSRGWKLAESPATSTPDTPQKRRKLKPQLLATIEKTKVRGNGYFAKGSYSQALTEYSQAVSLSQVFVDAMMEDDYRELSFVVAKSDEPLDPRIVVSTLFSNRAATRCQLGLYHEALEDAELVIRLTPLWGKGYLRRGEALMGMQDHRNAKKNFQRALSLLQDDEHIKERIQLVDIFEEDDRMGFRLHQLSVGRHICEKRAFFAPIQNLIWDYALQMKNYIYIIEHKASKECLVVDACWDIDGIIKYTDRFGLKIVGAIVTHHHIDHVGGIPPPPYDQYRIRVDGLAKLLRKLPTIKAYVNPSDIPQVTQANPELKAERLIETSDDAILFLPMSKNESSSDSNSNSKSGRLQLAAADTGSTATSEPHPEYISIKFIHTPGHTMGSQCVLLNQTRLLSGDTLFIGTCGRVDFSDSSVEKMYDSLFNKLTKLPPSTVVWPGHSYGGSFTTIEAETANGILSPKSKDEFMDQFCKAHARKHSPNDMSL